MSKICTICGKDYEYNAEVGYCKTLCSPYCDGKQRGISIAQAEINELKELLYEVCEKQFVTFKFIRKVQLIAKNRSK